jgi:hypothetical protein
MVQVQAVSAIYDALMGEVVRLIGSLNLQYREDFKGEAAEMQEQQDGEGGGEDGEGGGSSAGAGDDDGDGDSGAISIVPLCEQDQELFLSLVEMLQLLLPSLGRSARLFGRWASRFCTVVVERSEVLPKVSGLYKLVAVAVAVCDQHGFFTWSRSSPVASPASPLSSAVSLAEVEYVYRLLSHFLQSTLHRQQLFADELQLSCIHLQLCLPPPFLSAVTLAVGGSSGGDGSSTEDGGASLRGVICRALEVGLSHPPTAHLAIDAYQRWRRLLPRSVEAGGITSAALPRFVRFIRQADAAGGDGGEGGGSNAAGSYVKSHLKAIKIKRDAKRVTIGAASTAGNGRIQACTAEAALERRVLSLLGALGGGAGGSSSGASAVGAASAVEPLASALEGALAWDPDMNGGTPLEVSLPFGGSTGHLKLRLDGILPRLAELCEGTGQVEILTGASPREAKVAAAEALHALLLWMVGAAATDSRRRAAGKGKSDGGGGSGSYTRTFEKLLPVVLRLGVDEDTVVRQLFSTLLLQLVRWYSSADATVQSSKEAQVLLQTLTVGVSEPQRAPLRELAGRALEEFFKYAIKQRSKKEQADDPKSTAELLRRMWKLATHPSPYQRLGGCGTLRLVAPHFKNETSLVQRYALRTLCNLLRSLKLADKDGSQGGSANGSSAVAAATADAAEAAVDKFAQLVRRRASVLQGDKKTSAKKAKGGACFCDGDDEGWGDGETPTSLPQLVRMLFLNAGVACERRYRRKCLDLFISFTSSTGAASANASDTTPCVPGCNGPAHWVEEFIRAHHKRAGGAKKAPPMPMGMASASGGDDTMTEAAEALRFSLAHPLLAGDGDADIDEDGDGEAGADAMEVDASNEGVGDLERLLRAREREWRRKLARRRRWRQQLTAALEFGNILLQRRLVTTEQLFGGAEEGSSSKAKKKKGGKRDADGNASAGGQQQHPLLRQVRKFFDQLYSRAFSSGGGGGVHMLPGERRHEAAEVAALLLEALHLLHAIGLTDAVAASSDGAASAAIVLRVLRIHRLQLDEEPVLLGVLLLTLLRPSALSAGLKSAVQVYGAGGASAHGAGTGGENAEVQRMGLDTAVSRLLRRHAVLLDSYAGSYGSSDDSTLLTPGLRMLAEGLAVELKKCEACDRTLSLRRLRMVDFMSTGAGGDTDSGASGADAGFDELFDEQPLSTHAALLLVRGYRRLHHLTLLPHMHLLNSTSSATGNAVAQAAAASTKAAALGTELLHSLALLPPAPGPSPSLLELSRSTLLLAAALGGGGGGGSASGADVIGQVLEAVLDTTLITSTAGSTDSSGAAAGTVGAAAGGGVTKGESFYDHFHATVHLLLRQPAAWSRLGPRLLQAACLGADISHSAAAATAVPAAERTQRQRQAMAVLRRLLQDMLSSAGVGVVLNARAMPQGFLYELTAAAESGGYGTVGRHVLEKWMAGELMEGKVASSGAAVGSDKKQQQKQKQAEQEREQRRRRQQHAALEVVTFLLRLLLRDADADDDEDGDATAAASWRQLCAMSLRGVALILRGSGTAVANASVQRAALETLRLTLLVIRDKYHQWLVSWGTKDAMKDIVSFYANATNAYATNAGSFDMDEVWVSLELLLAGSGSDASGAVVAACLPLHLTELDDAGTALTAASTRSMLQLLDGVLALLPAGMCLPSSTADEMDMTTMHEAANTNGGTPGAAAPTAYFHHSFSGRLLGLLASTSAFSEHDPLLAAQHLVTGGSDGAAAASEPAQQQQDHRSYPIAAAVCSRVERALAGLVRQALAELVEVPVLTVPADVKEGAGEEVALMIWDVARLYADPTAATTEAPTVAPTATHATTASATAKAAVEGGTLTREAVALAVLSLQSTCLLQIGLSCLIPAAATAVSKVGATPGTSGVAAVGGAALSTRAVRLFVQYLVIPLLSQLCPGNLKTAPMFAELSKGAEGGAAADASDHGHWRLWLAEFYMSSDTLLEGAYTGMPGVVGASSASTSHSVPSTQCLTQWIMFHIDTNKFAVLSSDDADDDDLGFGAGAGGGKMARLMRREEALLIQSVAFEVMEALIGGLDFDQMAFKLRTAARANGMVTSGPNKVGLFFLRGEIRTENVTSQHSPQLALTNLPAPSPASLLSLHRSSCPRPALSSPNPLVQTHHRHHRHCHHRHANWRPRLTPLIRASKDLS